MILEGRPVGHMDAREYRRRKPEFLALALEALGRLRTACDLVIIEGAGSPAEINLKDEDIANMRVARAAQAPVLLVGDIDRGGVFASLVGTMELLDAEEREMVAGFVINKFRGSRELLRSALDFLAERTGKPVVGVVPYIRDLGLEEEDTVNLEEPRESTGGEAGSGTLEIVAVHLPHISNATDLDPLAGEPGVRLRYLKDPSQLGRPDAVIVPGSTATSDDLAYMRRSGMAAAVLRVCRQGGTPVIGICGGYQMLGERIEDPEGVECREGAVEGLGLLPVLTRMAPEKGAHRVKAVARVPLPLLGMDRDSPPLCGYGMHMGRSRVRGEGVLHIVERDGEKVSFFDGAQAQDPPAFGCCLHGLFENRAPREGFLNHLRAKRGMQAASSLHDWEGWRAERLDRLARIVGSSLDMRYLHDLLGLG